MSIAGNITSPEILVAAVASEAPLLMPGILLMVFVTILGAGHFYHKRITPEGNFPMWYAIAGLITAMGAFVLYLYPGFINLTTLIIAVVNACGGAMWFFLSPKDRF